MSSSPINNSKRDLSPREEVAVRYKDLLQEHLDAPDILFIGGHSLRSLDPDLVFLDEDQGEHPRTWPTKKKIRATALVAGFCFLSPFASTIFAPSVHLVMRDLGITDSTLGAFLVSVFLFAYAVGPLFLAPLSERYGRSIILHVGNSVFVAFSIGAGFSQTVTQFAICRLLAGIGGSCGLAVVGGTVADIWDLAARPKAGGLVTLGPVLGPILGPVCGGWMSERASWRWTLWVPAIAAATLGVGALLWLPESYAPQVLSTKLRKERVRCPERPVYSVLDFQEAGKGFQGTLLGQFARPLVYLVTDPALFLASLFYSVCFGAAYLIIVTFADVFALGYGQSVGIVGTNFLAMGLGMIVGTFATVKVMDRVFTRGGEKKFKPESRLVCCAPGLLIAVGGMFLYGFSALKTHFVVPLVGILIYSIGFMSLMMAIQLYAVEAFQFPASAFAAISTLRCLFAGAFPLFGAKLFATLGVDWGVGLLAFLTLGAGLVLLPTIYIYGERLRTQYGSSRSSMT